MSIARVRMVDWKGGIKDAIHLHGPVSQNYSKDKD